MFCRDLYGRFFFFRNRVVLCGGSGKGGLDFWLFFLFVWVV